MGRTLHDNGEDTSGVLATVRGLGAAVGDPMEALPRWGEIGLRVGDRLAGVAQTVPWGINMRRVVATLVTADAVRSGRLDDAAATRAVADAARIPAAGAVAFAIMCGFGAPALAALNGTSHRSFW